MDLFYSSIPNFCHCLTLEILVSLSSMFEFLRKEIVVLRKKNTKLKKELAEAESDKREIFNHASSVDHAFALSKIRNEQMSKTNMTLLDDNNKRRKELNKLKNELKTQQQAHERQLREMRSEFELALRYREMEVNRVEQDLHSSAAVHKREVQSVRDEAERKEEEHYSQISRLREEVSSTTCTLFLFVHFISCSFLLSTRCKNLESNQISKTQDTHQDYLSKLMDVLETTEESRRNMKAPSNDMVMIKKDEEIAELRDEVTRLRKTAGAESNGDVDGSKKEAIKSMKYIVKKNRENRKSKVQHLGDLTSQLEKSLASGDTSQMQQLVNSMKEAIRTSEKSNSKMDREMVNMIDNTASYYVAQDGVATADAALLQENQKLRRKLEKNKRERKDTVQVEMKEGEMEI